MYCLQQRDLRHYSKKIQIVSGLPPHFIEHAIVYYSIFTIYPNNEPIMGNNICQKLKGTHGFYTEKRGKIFLREVTNVVI